MEAAAVKIQKNLRRQLARRTYTRVKSSALVLQTGIRAMAARNEFRFREQTNAATVIQVITWLISCSWTRIYLAVCHPLSKQYFLKINICRLIGAVIVLFHTIRS